MARMTVVVAALILVTGSPACALAPGAGDKASCATLSDTASGEVEAALEAGAAPRALVERLAACLGDPDPDIRDGIAYGELTRLMRAGAVSEPDRRWLLGTLSAALSPDAPDGPGFRKPFAALVLSEVARTDRVTPWMSEAERGGLVEAGAAYVSGVTDYRGFDDADGWRHGVAHGADLLMQLSLNDAVGEAEAARILEAIGAQIGSDDAPAFIFDEPRRLARPLLFLTQRGLLGEDELTAWFEMVSAPAPLASWDEAFTSQSALARRHNLREFGYAVLVSATESEDEALEKLRPGALHILTNIP